MKLFMIIAMFFFYNQTTYINFEEKLEKPILYLYVDKLPKFKFDSGLNEYIFSKLKWLYQLDADGEVLISFIVQKDGKIKDVKKEKGLCSPFDIEVIKVIESMPDWEPGEVDSEKVDVKLYLPIEFGLNK